jgi:hypothetical protein
MFFEYHEVLAIYLNLNEMLIPVAALSKGVCLRPLTGWDCVFESLRWHGCLSFVTVVCFQVEVSAMGRSLVQRSRA